MMEDSRAVYGLNMARLLASSAGQTRQACECIVEERAWDVELRSDDLQQHPLIAADSTGFRLVHRRRAEHTCAPGRGGGGGHTVRPKHSVGQNRDMRQGTAVTAASAGEGGA
jgi:hypothetical protein